MQMGLLPGITPHAKDDEVMVARKAAKRRLGRSSDSVIAFTNEQGKIYRREIIKGLQQEVYLAERLEEIGIVDQTMQGLRCPKGTWAVFGPSLEGVLEGLKTGVRPLAKPPAS